MLKLKIGIKQISKFAVVLFFSTIIVACAIENKASSIPPDMSFEQKHVQAELIKLNSWTARGVIGIIYDNQAESANYIYSQKGDEFSIRLYGPLGIGSVEIKGNPDSVTIINSKGRSSTAKDAESLMLNELGWYVPVDGLKYWIKSLSIPGVKNVKKLKGNNLVEKLTQKGWDIKYSNYKIIDSKYPLPSKIKMTRDNLTLKIVVKSWQI